MSRKRMTWVIKGAFVFLITILYSCNSDNKADRAQIDEIMRLQEEAWNNGSLEDFMLAYWNSDSLTFIGSSGINYGWDKTLSNYKKSYPSKDRMGRLKFENINYKALGSQYYHINGKWNLFRNTDTLSGTYTLLWQKINDTWVIINDHSS